MVSSLVGWLLIARHWYAALNIGYRPYAGGFNRSGGNLSARLVYFLTRRILLKISGYTGAALTAFQQRCKKGVEEKCRRSMIVDAMRRS